MAEQLFLPGLERNPALDFLFFACVLRAEDAPRIVQLRERLCRELGLTGQLIAPELLHMSLHGIGAYDGLPNAVVESAKQAAATVPTSSLEIVFDRAMSFKHRYGRAPFVLRGDNDAALWAFHRVLGEAMKSVGFRRVGSAFTPHMTLLYGDRLVTEQSIDVVRWTVQDFSLVQSLRGRGQSQYNHLARWRLRG
jgi:2'-5' RNA ligase